jgi:hypothetical protein
MKEALSDDKISKQMEKADDLGTSGKADRKDEDLKKIAAYYGVSAQLQQTSNDKDALRLVYKAATGGEAPEDMS